jgi:hypothetical protein
LEFEVRWTVRCGCGRRNVPAAGENCIGDWGGVRDDRDNMRGPWSRRRQNVERTGIRMRVETLHVNDTLILLIQFGEMGMDQHCLTGVSVHMDERSIECRQKQRDQRAASSHWSHRGILFNAALEVNDAAV